MLSLIAILQSQVYNLDSRLKELIFFHDFINTSWRTSSVSSCVITYGGSAGIAVAGIFSPIS